jgi:hypothetical protein
MPVVGWEAIMLDFLQPMRAGRRPDGGRMADVGRHGAMKPAGRIRERDDMEAGE